ncbi:MAG: carboxynorspermidine decarboxylase [Thalassotalea sp.]
MKTDFSQLALSRLPSPCFVVDEVAIEANLSIINAIQTQSGAKILHALKAFSLWKLAGLTNQYLSGTCSSGLHEALLAKAHYSGEIHVFSAAYNESDLRELLTFADHLVFNSCSQLLRFYSLCADAKAKRPNLQFGLRVNPEHSEGDVPIYDPCAAGSRLGIVLAELEKHLQTAEFQQAFALISGFHFHTLCEQDFKPLARTLNVVEEKFAAYLPQLAWLNFGGGHHLTAKGYQIDELITRIKQVQTQYQLQVYLEPGEAIAIESGVLVTEVLDVCYTDRPQAILDTSATCHMPDTLEMPYRAAITGAGALNEKPFNFRLGGLTCLAGDVMGDYSFEQPLNVGQRLMFEDMAHYTMVKTSTFNGTKLPAIAVWNSKTDALTVLHEFNFQDFESRLS